MNLHRAPLVAMALLVLASVAWAHDLFLKLDSYFLAPDSRVAIPVLNGTFVKSEGFAAPDRIADISLVASAGRARLAAANAWSRGPDSASLLNLQLGGEGSYVAGVSLRPREISLSGKDFNAYLEEDGIPDILELRRRAGELEKPARERYSKHVKAVFQVGDRKSDSFGAILGYPAEIVPLDNPYSAAGRTTLRVRCLVDGQPVANQTILWGGERGGKLFPQRSVRTGPDGAAEVLADGPGRWYVKFVHMVRSAEAGFDYESKWATLTFEVR